MTILPCPPVTEALVHDIMEEVKSQAQAGTLTPEILAIGVMSLQDWNQYLDNLLDAEELEVTESGAAYSSLDTITEGKND